MKSSEIDRRRSWPLSMGGPALLFLIFQFGRGKAELLLEGEGEMRKVFKFNFKVDIGGMEVITVLDIR